MSQPSRSLRSDTRPLYVQAVDALYELLGKGAYEAGQLLPAEAALAAHLGVSRSTIREALGHAETVYTDTNVPTAFFRNYFVTDRYNFKIVHRIVRASGLFGRARAAQGGSEHGTV